MSTWVFSLALIIHQSPAATAGPEVFWGLLEAFLEIGGQQRTH